jgi:hypothetical protein
MAEYVLSKDDSQEEIAQMLIEHAGEERAGEIEWRPRPDRPQGGVFYVPDDLADGLTSDRLSRVDSTPENAPENVDTGSTTEGDGTTRTSRAAARRAAKAAEANRE